MGSSIVARIDLDGYDAASAATASAHAAICAHIQRRQHRSMPAPPGKPAVSINVRSFRQTSNPAPAPSDAGSSSSSGPRRMMHVLRRSADAGTPQSVEGADATVLIEDAEAQKRSEWVLQQRTGKGKTKAVEKDQEANGMDVDEAPRPPHFRSTLAVLPGSFDPLLANTLSLHPGSTSQANVPLPPARWIARPAVILLEGVLFRLGGLQQGLGASTPGTGDGETIEADWLVRVLTVAVRGNAPRSWVVVELEYLADRTIPTSSRFLTSALKSLLPTGAHIKSFVPTADDLVDVGLGLGGDLVSPEAVEPLETPTTGGTGRRNDFAVLRLLQREGLL